MAVLFYEPVVHCGVAEYAVIGKAATLDFPRLQHPLRNDGTRFGRTPLDQLAGIDRMHPQLDIYSVHDGTGEFREVGKAAGGRAAASVPFAVESAWTRVCGGDEHEIGREFDLCLQAGDRHLAVLHRSTKDLEYLLRSLAELVDRIIFILWVV